MIPEGVLPGFIAATGSVLEAEPRATVVECGAVRLAYWGLTSLSAQAPVLPLSRIVRTTSGALSGQQLIDGARSRPEELMTLLPPFALATGDTHGVRMLADSMGFRQLYHTDPGAPGRAVMSTTALGIAEVRDCQLDDTGVAVQSLLGWQLGQRTLFSGVSKLAPGSIASAWENGISVTAPKDAEDGELELSEAVRTAAALLRESLSALLDDHPDAVLQLTGGQDSRILLSAIPPARRRGLRAMTLGVPGSGDVEVASQISSRYGLVHEVHGLARLEDLSPDQAWELARSAAVRLDAMSDPIALAALAVGESKFDQGVRISGLGGEVARGFYYVGKVSNRTYTKRDAEQLAGWRMFANEAVEPGMLNSDFAEWGRQAADAEVYSALLDGGAEWFRATDHLYLRHRMQRWAGVTDTAVAYQRLVLNPMLDCGFLNIASRLTPSNKARSLFLARLQMELDPELGQLPLDGRPAPVTYATPNMRHRMDQTYTTWQRFGRKAAQRIRRANRAPAGGETLAMRVVESWRAHPPAELLSDILLDKVSSSWLDDILAGRVQPRASSVAFLTNLVVTLGSKSKAPR